MKIQCMTSLSFLSLLLILLSKSKLSVDSVPSNEQANDTKSIVHSRRLDGTAATNVRGALIVTLAGSKKLAPYFEWSCISFGYSKELFDMLVFHESNEMIQRLECPSNVKFIDLGPHGLSTMIVEKILDGSNVDKSVITHLQQNVDRIITHIPRYLVEVKPLLGSLFGKYLDSYTHWSYTDPDIIWGNLADWVLAEDLQQYDLLSIAKNNDAGRLFLRGQLTFHHNAERINDIWKQLEYFNYGNFAERISNACRMLDQKKVSDHIFSRNFQSAEGWYSQLIFKHSDISLKIIGRGFDDFFENPVILQSGQLTRCPVTKNITNCFNELEASNVTARSLPPMKLIEAAVNYDESVCKMFWLPNEVRFCVTTTLYDKDMRENHKPRLRLQRVGEVVLESGKWYINDEKQARRQILEHAAFFHFRHWDDVIAKGFTTKWPVEKSNLECMVLYLDIEEKMAFESCDAVITKEKAGAIVHLAGKHIAGSAPGIGKLLAMSRKSTEVGANMNFIDNSAAIGGNSEGGGSSITSHQQKAKKKQKNQYLRTRKQTSVHAHAGSADTSASTETENAQWKSSTANKEDRSSNLDGLSPDEAERVRQMRRKKRSKMARGRKRMKENRKPHTGWKVDAPEEGGD